MNIRTFMKDNDINYLLVNSTNEFLVEYNTLNQNSRYKLTGFSGSTGEALVTPETIYLFVDGRYHIQADQEVNHDITTVVKLQTGQNAIEEIINKIPENEILGVFSKKNSQNKIEQLSKSRKLKLLDTDPHDEFINYSSEGDLTIDTKYTGVNSEDKISAASKNLSQDEAIYITDPDEVSYLFNMRNFTRQPYSAKIMAKAIILKDNAILFNGEKLKNLNDFLTKIQQKVYVDKNTINAYEYNLLGDKVAELKFNPVKLAKSQKNKFEIAHLKEAFTKTDRAVLAIRDFINNNDNLSEFDIALQLAKEFKNQGALNLSFASIVAKDQNSSLAHYSKCSKNEIISDGSLILIDCGGYFEGGLATDITRVFVKGEPSQLHKNIYTNVLKAFLNAYNYCKTHSHSPVTGYEIDQSAREFFNQQNLDGFVFNHGLGHGIGINVHEYPPNLSANEIAKVPLLEGECFSIEPGLYKEGCFGIRLENSCYYSDNNIHSLTNMPYEKKLIDYDMLNNEEKAWLEEFEVI